jgi:hypothetical protein
MEYVLISGPPGSSERDPSGLDFLQTLYQLFRVDGRDLHPLSGDTFWQ